LLPAIVASGASFSVSAGVCSVDEDAVLRVVGDVDLPGGGGFGVGVELGVGVGFGVAVGDGVAEGVPSA